MCKDPEARVSKMCLKKTSMETDKKIKGLRGDLQVEVLPH